MSVKSTRIHCTGCNYEVLDGRGPIGIDYIDRDGKKIYHFRTKGWCYDCDNYVDMENINPDQVNDNLKFKEQEHAELTVKLRNPTKSSFIQFLNPITIINKVIGRKHIKEEIKFIEAEIDNLSALLLYFSNRTTEARCLKCGSENTTPLIFSDTDHLAHDFKHKCGGQLSNEIDNSLPQFRQQIPPVKFTFDYNGELIDKL